jgi:hypothetical protein
LILAANLWYLAGAYWNIVTNILALPTSPVEALQLHNHRLAAAYLRMRPAWRVLGKQFFTAAEKPLA